MILRASLANKDVASENELTVGAFGAQTLGFAITTVVRRTRSFFMSEQLYIHKHNHSTSNVMKSEKFS